MRLLDIAFVWALLAMTTLFIAAYYDTNGILGIASGLLLIALIVLMWAFYNPKVTK